MNMKKILAMLCIVALSLVSVVGTVAYLTDRSSVANTFTVGNVDINLDEADVNEAGIRLDKDGNPMEEGSTATPADRVIENQYHLIPGQTYVKDPTMTVLAGSEESYVRMIVTINKAAELKAIFGENFLPQDYVNGTWDASIWTPVSMTEDTTENVLKLEFRYHETVSTMEPKEDKVLEPLFENFTLPGDKVNGEQLATLTGFKIMVEGHAIQAATFADANEAWAAFDKQVNP